MEGSELLIFSEAATAGLTECERSCMRLAPQDVPPSGRLTTVPIEGGFYTHIELLIHTPLPCPPHLCRTAKQRKGAWSKSCVHFCDRGYSNHHVLSATATWRSALSKAHNSPRHAGAALL